MKLTIEQVKERILKNTSEIETKQGIKKHVNIRGWQTLGKYFDTVLTIGFIEAGDGWARAYAYDGDRMVSSGYCSRTETKPYSKAKWDQFAVEGMAQTRALSRGYKHKFAFFLEEMNENLSDTPAEETGMEPQTGSIPTVSEMIDKIKHHLSEETRATAKGLDFSVGDLYAICLAHDWDDLKVKNYLAELKEDTPHEEMPQ